MPEAFGLEEAEWSSKCGEPLDDMLTSDSRATTNPSMKTMELPEYDVEQLINDVFSRLIMITVIIIMFYLTPAPDTDIYLSVMQYSKDRDSTVVVVGERV